MKFYERKVQRNIQFLACMALAGCAPTLVGTLKARDGGLHVSADSRVNITSLSVPGERRMASLAVSRKGTFSTREALPPGDYLVEALVPGYAVASRRVKIGTAEHVTLTLQPAFVAKGPGIGVNAHPDQGRGAGAATLTPPSL